MGTNINRDIEIRILRSDRKSLVGQVLDDGSIEVRAPLMMSAETISKWLDKYEHKFMPMVKRCREIQELKKPLTYGGEVLFLGKRVPIIAAEDDNKGYMILYKNGAFVTQPGLSEDEMRKWISWELSDLAKPILEKKLWHYSDLMGVHCKTWTIGNARKRHGSCDSNGKIIFSWLVIMMSEPVIDYIIVHELAHLKQQNHSSAFHEEVAKILPDWEECRKAYNDYGFILRCDGWI